MPGSNAGTGYPLTLRCAKCKAGRDWENPGDRAGENIEATGRTKPLLSSQQGRGNPRALYFRAEYRCKDCGHIGWTRLKAIKWIAQRQGITLVEPEG